MEKLTDQHKLELKAFLKEKDRVREEINRAQGILLVSAGISAEIIESLTGLEKSTLVKIRKKYIRNGIKAISSNRKEKKFRSLLTKQQREEIYTMLYSQTPKDYGRYHTYWTPSILGDVILERYGVKYKSKSSMHLIFKQSKFTYHKPEKIYEKRNEELIDQWKKDNNEYIQQILKDEEVVVLCADEMILTSQTTTQRIWLPEGVAPFIQHSNTKKRRSLYGFLNIKTGEQMAFKADKQTSDITAKILQKVLSKFPNKKVVLFWDNAPWHKGEAMRTFLAQCNNFHIVYFPVYAPDLNPQEHVWKDGRAKVTHNTFIPDIDVTVREFLTYLNNTIFKYEFFGFTAF